MIYVDPSFYKSQLTSLKLYFSIFSLVANPLGPFTFSKNTIPFKWSHSCCTNLAKNSFNLLLNSNIYGATQKEILIAAFTCASQNLDEFDILSWAKYKDMLNDEDLEIVKKLSVIVKMARLIDKSKTCDHIACDVLGDKCILNIVPKSGEESRLDDVKKAIPDFKKAFDKHLQVL